MIEWMRYVLADEVALEDFEGLSLVFLANQLKVVEVNQTASWILSVLDGEKSIKEISRLVAERFDIQRHKALSDVKALILELGGKGVLKPIPDYFNQGRRILTESEMYVANPDVSTRQEGEEGALLYNPNTKNLLVINQVGLLIWNYIQMIPRSTGDILGYLQEECEGIPLEQAKNDVNSFLQDLLSKAFAGNPENDQE